MDSTPHQSDNPDLDRDELLDAFDDLLWETCRTGNGWHTRFGYGAAVLEGEHEVDYLPPFGRTEVTIAGPGTVPVAIVAVVLASVLAKAVFN